MLLQRRQIIVTLVTGWFNVMIDSIKKQTAKIHQGVINKTS